MLSFFFEFIDSYVFIPTAIAQTLNRIAEHAKLIEILSKEAKAEIRIHPVATEAKIRKCSI